ncbi:LAETG motif-containing sortase-dependent surface protein [Streptomyces sp. NPDC002935]|uniref:LAETG motif-containing sortase-dependent surface protein n=1 Tax=unclassified Streptomyces TaxID=2593676 RepID=UPI0033347C41
MSIARRVTLRCLLGTGAAAFALCAVTTTASATDKPGGDGWDKTGSGFTPGQGAGTATEADRCQFSLDGTHFYDSVQVDDENLKPTEDGKVHIKVRAADDAGSCTASLAAYRAHGATFKTSGVQVFHDFDTVSVKPGATDSLDISVPDAGCFAQIDLYRGAVKFDGKHDAQDGFEHGDLPAGPDHAVIKDKLIMAWNGGKKDCTAQPTTPETPPASTPPAETPGTPASSAPATPATPSAPETSATPSAPESSTSAAPSPNGGGSTPSGDLAETGGGSTLPIAGAAVAVLAAGGAITVATRRRRATGTRS